MNNNIIVKSLGQVGYRFDCGGVIIYIDPYLSNSVEEKYGSELKRLVPIRIQPSDIDDANYVLITHGHEDHCDLATLLPIYESSKNCLFICPSPVYEKLLENGIEKKRLVLVTKDFKLDLGLNISLSVVPSAHPDIQLDVAGNWKFVGYVINIDNFLVYHCGDTAVHAEIVDKLKLFDEIDVGLIPVNERNYYRENKGIIGNMSIREAFQFAEDAGIKNFVPTHWDMFAQNLVYQEEVELLYRKIQPRFNLVMDPKVF